jgi:hypothetical protein
LRFAGRACAKHKATEGLPLPRRVVPFSGPSTDTSINGIRPPALAILLFQ